MLRGHYAGANSELQLIPGAVTPKAEVKMLGAGVCGMASDEHWKLDLCQHHWLELKFRTDDRKYELVVQVDPQRARGRSARVGVQYT